MTFFIRLLTCLLISSIGVTTVHAQRAPRTPAAQNIEGETLSFSIDTQQRAINDLMTAELFIEQTDTQPAVLSQHINQTIAKALETAKAYPDVQVQTSGISTAPLYAKSGGKIESWRMRSDIRLETKNFKSLSELVGKLQTTLMLANITMALSPETRTQAIEAATVDAIHAFEKRAKLLASTRGKRYRIISMDINDSGFTPLRVMAMASDSKLFSSASGSSVPLEGGSSTVTINIRGSIELLD